MNVDASHINERFDISADDIEHMWRNAANMPAESLRDGAHFHQKIRRSSDGEWLIRRHRSAVPAVRLLEVMDREFGRLRELGMNIISYAATPVPQDQRSIYVVAPWLQLRACALPAFTQTVKPILSNYYEGSLRSIDTDSGHIYLGNELARPDQFSSYSDPNQPFLHDTEPQVVQGSFHAELCLESLAKLNIQNANSELMAA